MTEDRTDRMLQRYFKSQVPQPWPGFSYPEASPIPLETAVPRRRARSGWGRLALAASVALVFLGYLSLARFFPASDPVPSARTPHGASNLQLDIAKGLRDRPRESRPKVQPTLSPILVNPK